MYADALTDSMRRAIDETYRRRGIQEAYNREHGITPQGIKKAIRDITDRVKTVTDARNSFATDKEMPKEEMFRLIKELEVQMRGAAKNLEFENAALIRDEIVDLKRALAP